MEASRRALLHGGFSAESSSRGFLRKALLHGGFSVESSSRGFSAKRFSAHLCAREPPAPIVVYLYMKVLGSVDFSKQMARAALGRYLEALESI